MSHTKLKLGMAISAIFAVSSVAQAVDYSISGHVNQMVRYADDSNTDQSDTQFVDNGTNASRLSLSAGGDFAGMEVEVFTQFRWDANNSALTAYGDGGDGSDDLQAAYLDIAFKHDFGTFSIGRGDGAARFTQRQDLSGTELADNFDVRRWFTGDADHVGFEGARNDRVRYDAPSLLGLNFSVSADSDGTTEVGLTWDSEAEAYSEYWEGLRWIGAVGYSNVKEDDIFDTDERIAASLSALLGGTSLTVGYGEESYEGGGDDYEGTYIKLGQRFGDHAFSISMTAYEEGSVEDDVMAVGYQFNGEGGVDVYAGYSQLDPEFGDDFDQFIVGTRVRF